MRILLAYDGQPASDGAVRQALAISQRSGATVEVLRVLEPFPVYGSELIYGPWTASAGVPEGRGEWALEEVRNRLQEFGPEASAWPIAVELGPVPFVIALAADRREADLIVIGLGRHDRLDRWFGTETALRVMQISHIPVLAVEPGATELPRVVVAAVDFSDFSRDAVSSAIRYSAPGATLHLAHVLWQRPTDLPSYTEVARPENIRQQVQEQMEAWVGDIPGIGEVQVKQHLLEGTIAKELLRLADEVRAELLVAGSHGMGFLGRLMLGSVSTRLIRGAKSSVLIAPPRERAPELEADRSGVAANPEPSAP
jgi:nucleotide-binding universal stress UspA family protein